MSRVIGPGGGSLTSVTVQTVSTVFPVGSVTKDTKVGLQVIDDSHLIHRLTDFTHFSMTFIF